MAKILIVDNDPDIVESIKVILESKGYEIEIATSGEEGLKKVKENKPDAIILDVMMETVDKGFEVCKILKLDDETKNIPIMMLTAIKELSDMGYSMDDANSMMLDMDAPNVANIQNKPEADMFCEKPISSEDLISRIEKLLK